MSKIKQAPDGERTSIDGTEALPLSSSDSVSSWWTPISRILEYVRTAAITFTNKTLTAPTIADFTNAIHDHQDNDDGGTLAEAALALTDITTNNSSIAKHGFLPKLSGDSDTVLNGDGEWITASGGITYAQADPYGIHHRLSGSSSDDDEFSSDTSANYTEVDPTGTTTWLTANHVLSCVFTSQMASDLGAYVKPMTLADGEWFETCIHTLTKKLTDFTMAGLVITDGTSNTSNAIALLCYTDQNSGQLAFEVRTGTLTSMSTSTQLYLMESGSIMGGIRIRLKRNSSTSFTPYASGMDGAQFSSFGLGNTNPGFTPTHAGVFVSTWGGSHTAIASFDYLRHMA